MPFFLNYFLTVIMILILSPIMVLIILIIYFSFGRAIFFIQERVGYKNKIFKIIKFRTMKNINKSNTSTENITKIGHLLRRYSFDELPNLFNIIKGEMNLVGPRPLLVEYLDLYTDDQKERHNVKPGITGLAQINGRNNISWNKKFEYDLLYVKNKSFILDIRIILKTVRHVLIAKNINKSNLRTADKFKGK